MPDSPQKTSQKTMDKLKISGRKLEDAGVTYLKRTNKHMIEVAVDKAELFDELIENTLDINYEICRLGHSSKPESLEEEWQKQTGLIFKILEAFPEYRRD